MRKLRKTTRNPECQRDLADSSRNSLHICGKFHAVRKREIRPGRAPAEENGPKSNVMITAVNDQRGRGKFITIEGLDGCGKSTQLSRLADSLRALGIDVRVTREPGGTEIGEKIRAVLLDSKTQGLSPWAELALMFASRAQQIEQLILPALDSGAWVLCDRFTDSSEAYQGGGRGLGSQPVLDLHRVLCHGLQPDLTILMDSEVAHSVDRARRRNLKQSSDDRSDENRFEQENREFFRRVHEAYLAIAQREPDRVFMVDARRPAEIVQGEIFQEVRRRFLGAAAHS
jgi:dTMP kinase